MTKFGEKGHRGRQRKTTDEQWLEIAQKWTDGVPQKDLAKEYNLHPSTISTVLKQRGVRRREPVTPSTTSLNEFIKRARSVLWRQDHGQEKPSYEKWDARVKELQSKEGSAYSKGAAVVQASKEFPCLYRLFREYDMSTFDPNPESHPGIQHYGHVTDVGEVYCENKEQSHRDNLTWAIDAAGEFLRTGKIPSICPNNSSWYLFIQAREEPKDFLSRFTQIESKNDDSAKQRQERKTGQRSVQELETMLEALTKDEQVAYTEEALREIADSEDSTERSQEEKQGS